ncbi:MAG: glycoside hydrolase family 13 protein [Ruminococcaceae bacterium]|nr:glycoside hydrolase family 13 protein [Oscillospiraceae bacterium]
MKTIPFDSRDKNYKTPFGAVSSKENITLRVLLHDDALATDVFLKLRDDNSGTVWIAMDPAEYMDGHFRWYNVNLTLKEGLYWYSFCFDSAYGRKDITKYSGGEGLIGSDGGQWQLTVYEHSFKTPDNFAGGIIYQIFPDRFFNSKTPKHNVPEDRFVRTDYWNKPEYRQDNGPCSLGNDYFCGDLNGITGKLDYIADLGVSVIYLNPIFEAHSNHRYNTANYMNIDPMLGTEADFKKLCREAKKRGISIVLDGVFSHTGDDSVYFNRYGRYDTLGAYQSEESEYHKWFKFTRWPDKYSAWWGVPSLPETNEDEVSFTKFITGKNGVVRRWLRLGASGWRLDVADELPDAFLDKIRQAAKAEKSDAIIIGEVWEDATNKISYGARRRYLRGRQLDSVMNYPFANALINFVKGGSAEEFTETVMTICENYPKKTLNLLMNHIGTHDTPRVLTALGGLPVDGRDRAWQNAENMDKEQLEYGKKLLYLVTLLQYTLPGIPSLYYGDEAGVEGYSDPFCRGFFPWGREDKYLTEYYRKLGAFRRSCEVFKDGDFVPVYHKGGQVAFLRHSKHEQVLVCVNRESESATFPVVQGFEQAEAIFGRNPIDGVITVDGYGFSLLRKKMSNHSH